MTYTNCKKIIELNKFSASDMLNKLDVFFLGDRITKEQYEELTTEIAKRMNK